MTQKPTRRPRLPLARPRLRLRRRVETVAAFITLALLAITTGAAWHEIDEATDEEGEASDPRSSR